MNKIFLILLSMTFAGVVFAQALEARPALNNREKIISTIDSRLEDGLVLEFLRKADVQIKGSIRSNKALTSSQYFSYASSIKTWAQYRWLIADTGLSKNWLEKIHKLLAYMSKTKRYMQIAEFSGRAGSAKYKKASGYFDLAYGRFGKLIKKPVRVSTESRQQSRVQKDIWQRKMRKKYNIKEKSWYE